MPGSGWAAVQTWVRNAEAKQNDLQIVSADQARPGDIVAYDWGHQDDFGSDGHIGFLASNVQGGKFTALEGNNHDAVMKVPRDVNMANVKFIRIGGDAPPPAGAGSAGSRRARAASPTRPPRRSAVEAAPTRYPGDNAAKAQLAAWLGREAREARAARSSSRSWPRSSSPGVKNLNYGDADSVGFFQMRVGIWNQGAYAGFPEKPELQVKWFLDQAEAVKKQRIARGQSVTDPKQFGDWIADIERPAEQYRGRYELRLGEANGLLAPAPAARAAPAPRRSSRRRAAAAVDAAGGGRRRAGGRRRRGGPAGAGGARRGREVHGHAYKWGGSTPQTGFDCSGLVQWAYAKAGIQIPRVTDAQIAASNGTSVDRGDLQPGDLVFFAQAGQHPPRRRSRSAATSSSTRRTPATWCKVSSLERALLLEQVRRRPALRQQPRRSQAAAAARARRRRAGRDRPAAVAEAQAAVARDAAEVSRQRLAACSWRSRRMEERRHDTVQFMKAIDRKDAAAAAGQPQAAAAAAAGRRRSPAAAAPRPGRAPTPPSPRRRPAPTPAQPVDRLLVRHLRRLPGQRRRRRTSSPSGSPSRPTRHGLPPELPVMASLVESGVKNLNFGDADSVGFFQMRVGIWNQGDYAGYPENPELQAKWFIDQALAVKKQGDRRRATPTSARTRRSGASGSPTSSAPPSSTAAATSCGSREARGLLKS